MAFNIKKISDKIGLKPGLLQQLGDIRNTSQLKKKTKEAVSWYKTNLQKILGMNSIATRQQAIRSAKNSGTNTLEIGSMFQFVYDAKWKNVLPYWDKFPLILVVEKYTDGFLGLNLHYLSPPIRAVLLDQLLEFKTANLRSSLPNKADDLNSDTRLLISWSLLKNSTRHRMIYPCVKRYLYTHIQSNFLKINPTEWEQAIFLPLENFQKETKEYVWEQSGF